MVTPIQIKDNPTNASEQAELQKSDRDHIKKNRQKSAAIPLLNTVKPNAKTILMSDYLRIRPHLHYVQDLITVAVSKDINTFFLSQKDLRPVCCSSKMLQNKDHLNSKITTLGLKEGGLNMWVPLYMTLLIRITEPLTVLLKSLYTIDVDIINNDES
jgi:hypothetical protein